MRSFLLVAGLGLFLQSCSGRNAANDASERYFFDALQGGDAYSKAYAESTKEKRIYSEFEPVMTAYVTFWNQKLREAYVKERSAQYRLPDEDQKQLAKEELAENEAFYVFVITTYTREPEWNDLERKKSLWRITLEDPKANLQVEPERVEAVSQNDQIARYFYKRMDNFGRTYRVRFPRQGLADAADVQLHISGPRGGIAFNFPTLKAEAE